MLLSKLGIRKFNPTGICDEGAGLVAMNPNFRFLDSTAIVEEPVFKNVKNKHLGMSPF